MAVYYFVGKPYTQAWVYGSRPVEGDLKPGDVVVEKEFDSMPEGRIFIVGEAPNYDIRVVSITPKIDPLEEKVKLQEAQIQALSDQNDFLEECIVEMAQIVYNF